MTPVQRRLLAVVAAYISEYACSPSYAEISQRMGWASKSACGRSLARLERDGYISRGPGKTRRSIKIVPRSLPPVPLDEQRTRALLSVFTQIDQYRRQQTHEPPA